MNEPLTPEQVSWALSILKTVESEIMASDELEDLEAVEKAADADRERERQDFAKAAEAEKAKEATHAEMKRVIGETRSQIVRWRAVKILWQKRAVGLVEAEPALPAEAPAAGPATSPEKATVMEIPKWPAARIAG